MFCDTTSYYNSDTLTHGHIDTFKIYLKIDIFCDTKS